MKITYEVLTIDGMYERFLDHKSKDPYKKIKELSKEIKYLHFGNESYHTSNKFFCAFIDEELVGIAKLRLGGEDSLSQPGWNNWIGFISVRKGYFGKGIGRGLVEELFKYAGENQFSILTSGYSLRGWVHLRKHIHMFAAIYGVELNDPETRPKFLDWDMFEGFSSNEEYDEMLQKVLKNS